MDGRSKAGILVSWGRYLFWAELRYRDWYKYMDKKGENAAEAISEWLGVSCYWAASLYVVIEGWETAKFKDPIIDALIALPKYRKALKRLRNGTFHYQPEVISPKVMEFLEATDVTDWLNFLRGEFRRWFYDQMEKIDRFTLRLPMPYKKWRKIFSDLVGELPSKPLAERIKRVNKQRDKVARKLEAEGSGSERAQDLRDVLDLCDLKINEAQEWIRNYRREQLAKFGLEPDTFLP
jgi:hypothetical protein